MSDLHKAAEEALRLLERWTLTIDGEWGAVRSLEAIEADGDLPVEMVKLREALERQAHGDMIVRIAEEESLEKEREQAFIEQQQRRDDIIRLAQEAGFDVEIQDMFNYKPQHSFIGSDENIERFAALVAAAEREKAEAEIINLKTVMIAAAEEIAAHWKAHCDAEGYGPTNLMHRLEKGIPAQYGYTAGDFERLRAENESLRAAIRARGET
jgi:regulator of replication initiation timing